MYDENINVMTNEALQLLARTLQEIGEKIGISQNFLTKIVQKTLTDEKFQKKHFTGIGNILIPVNIFILIGRKNYPYLHSAIKQWLKNLNKKG